MQHDLMVSRIQAAAEGDFITQGGRRVTVNVTQIANATHVRIEPKNHTKSNVILPFSLTCNIIFVKELQKLFSKFHDL